MRPTPFPTHFYSPPFHSLHHHTVQSIPSPFTRLKTNTPYPFQNIASQTLSFTTTKETVCEASGSILYPRAYTLHDETRVTHQSPSYEPLRRSNNSRRTPEGLQKDSRRTPEGLQKDETTTQKPSVECACAMHCGAVQCTALHCIAL